MYINKMDLTWYSLPPKGFSLFYGSIKDWYCTLIPVITEAHLKMVKSGQIVGLHEDRRYDITISQDLFDIVDEIHGGRFYNYLCSYCNVSLSEHSSNQILLFDGFNLVDIKIINDNYVIK